MHLRKVSTLFAMLAALLLSAGTAQATILVGTFQESSNTSINVTNINILIDSYNSDFLASLPTLGVDDTYLAKAEVPKLDKFTGGNSLDPSWFDWFRQDAAVDIDNPTPAQHVERIFGTNVGFSETGDGNPDKVRGFFQNPSSTSTFNYYVAKNGNEGWSLWYTGGVIGAFHPVYIDNGTTRGDSTMDANPPHAQYSPAVKELSNITFWQATDPFVPESNGPIVIPEPSSLALLGMGLLSLVGYGYRRRRQIG